MKDNNIGCLGWAIVLITFALIIWRMYAIIASDIPVWLKFYLLGR